MDIEIKIKGKKVFLFLAALLFVWLIISYSAYKAGCDNIDKAKELIISKLKMESSWDSQDMMEEIKRTINDRKAAAEMLEKVNALFRIQIDILDVRGGFFGGFYVKCGVTYDGKTISGRNRIEYFLVEHSILTGFDLTTPLDVFRMKTLYDIALWR